MNKNIFPEIKVARQSKFTDERDEIWPINDSILSE